MREAALAADLFTASSAPIMRGRQSRVSHRCCWLNLAGSHIWTDKAQLASLPGELTSQTGRLASFLLQTCRLVRDAAPLLEHPDTDASPAAGECKDQTPGPYTVCNFTKNADPHFLQFYETRRSSIFAILRETTKTSNHNF